jgi:hypothetical protein
VCSGRVLTELRSSREPGVTVGPRDSQARDGRGLWTLKDAASPLCNFDAVDESWTVVVMMFCRSWKLAARGKGRPRSQSAAFWAVASLRVTAAIDPFERPEGIASYYSTTRHYPSLQE